MESVKFHLQMHSFPVILDLFGWLEKIGIERAALNV